ncbi:hypothetical protein J1605_011335 [Eschrichtius robustus]|uniref:Uncharacterized protein n=1 Tax=Eschrichtius robustus TaxID=9764 RepID=A0AB34GPA7_ESCRO|nr:hypothetical protein J1605_011335 [Eschrichtius robustus]
MSSECPGQQLSGKYESHGLHLMTVLVVGLLLPNQTLASTVFWQWLNQSHNACVNYANRNATKPSPASKFIQGYLGAVISAVSIAVSNPTLPAPWASSPSCCSVTAPPSISGQTLSEEELVFMQLMQEWRGS